jgi:hypothetical protein
MTSMWWVKPGDRVIYVGPPADLVDMEDARAAPPLQVGEIYTVDGVLTGDEFDPGDDSVYLSVAEDPVCCWHLSCFRPAATPKIEARELETA